MEFLFYWRLLLFWHYLGEMVSFSLEGIFSIPPSALPLPKEPPLLAVPLLPVLILDKMQKYLIGLSHHVDFFPLNLLLVYLFCVYLFRIINCFMYQAFDCYVR